MPTTQILLNWADNESSAHRLDSNLKTITLRTADAFNVSMDVSVIIHIAIGDAPKVVANLGSVDNTIRERGACGTAGEAGACCLQLD